MRGALCYESVIGSINVHRNGRLGKELIISLITAIPYMGTGKGGKEGRRRELHIMNQSIPHRPINVYTLVRDLAG